MHVNDAVTDECDAIHEITNGESSAYSIETASDAFTCTSPIPPSFSTISGKFYHF